MENEATLFFERVIQMLVSTEEFNGIKNELSYIPVKHRKAFWNLVLAGFSIKSAFKNCKVFYEFVKYNNLNHTDALRMILFMDKELKTGIYSKEIEMFEVN